MTDDIVFVQTRHKYDSYADLWRLIELCGFPLIYPDEIPERAPDTTFIISPVNGEWKEWPEDRTTGNIVFWNLEWGKGDPLPCVSETWTSDRWHAQHIGARYVPFGSHPDLCPTERNGEFIHDVILLAWRNWPRQVAEGLLQGAGLNVAPDGWGEQRRKTLERTRCMVNIHQHQRDYPGTENQEDYHCVPVQRFAVAASARIPLISQPMFDSFPFTSGVHFLAAEMRYIADAVQALTPERGRELADNMWVLLCEYRRFDRVVKAYVRQGVGV